MLLRFSFIDFRCWQITYEQLKNQGSGYYAEVLLPLDEVAVTPLENQEEDLTSRK